MVSILTHLGLSHSGKIDLNYRTEKEVVKVGLRLVRKYENLVLEAYWDVNAYRIGYGTKSKKGEKVTKKEAAARLQKSFERFRRIVIEKYPLLDDWQTSVITSALYNCGHFEKNLDKALRDGNISKAAEILLIYTKSNGVELRGLVSRRKEESRLLTLPTHIRHEEIRREYH